MEDGVPSRAVPFGPPLVVAAVLVWLFAFLPATANAQTRSSVYPFKIETIQNDKMTQVVARNEGPAVMTVEVQMHGENATSDHPWQLVDVVAPFTEKVLATLSPIDSTSSYQIATRMTRLFGDAFAQVNTATVQLPFQNGQRIAIGQAFGSTLTTHQDAKLQHAVDFEMPENSPVIAVRDGVVVETVVGYQAGGLDPQLAEQANMVKLQHADGTSSIYAHLSPSTPKLFVGQEIKAGVMIGLSGNTGYSSGPHLHFCVSKPIVGPLGLEEVCLPVKFVAGTPTQLISPHEGMVVQVNDSGSVEISQRSLDHANALDAPSWPPRLMSWMSASALQAPVTTGIVWLDDWLAALGWIGALGVALIVIGFVWLLGRIAGEFG